MKLRICLALNVVFLGLVVPGCGVSGLHQVTGTVQFDGAPLKEGRILFRSEEGEKRAYAGEITNGSYSVACAAGKMRVEITASRLIAGKFDTTNGTKEPVGVMFIPAKYNSQSTLVVVVDGGSRNHPFDLKGK